MKVIPSFYIQKYRFVPLHVDFNLLMEFLDEKLRGGLMYTAGADNSLGFLIGTRLNNLMFNYSYNISFNEIQPYNNGGHEIGIGVILGGNQKESN